MSTKNDKFLQDYESICKFMRAHFLFDDFTVDRADELGISKSRYNELKSTLAAYIGNKDDNTENKRINNRKTFSLKNSMFVNGYNYFCDIFGSKNIVSSQFECYILILQALCKSGSRPLSTVELIDNISCPDNDHRAENGQKNCDIIDGSTLNNHIKNLEDLGYIKAQNSGNAKLLRLSNDCLDLFRSGDEMVLFLDMISLMRNIIQPYLCGNMMFETAQTSFEERGKINDYKNPFTFAQSHFEQVLDDEIAWKLICAIHSKNKISFKYRGKDRVVSPLEIETSADTGRRYLLAADEKDSLISLRLDRISNVVTANENYDAKPYDSRLKVAKRYSFTGSVLLKDGEAPQTVDLEFLPQMKETVEKLFPDAEIIAENDTYSAKILLNDAKEIKPWLRRNIGNVKVKDGTPLAEEMEKDAEEWRRVYGIV